MDPMQDWRGMRAQFSGKQTRSFSSGIESGQLPSRGELLRHNFPDHFFSSHDTIDFHTCISAGYKFVIGPPDNPVCLELTFSKEQNDVAWSWRFSNRLDVQDVSILDRRPHAAATGTKAESIPLRDQLAG